MIVRGTTATNDELTGNFASTLEDTSISDYRFVALFAEKSLKAIFGVLQHNPPKNGHVTTASACSFRADSVAKVPKRRGTKFPLNDKTSGNRRST